MQFDAPIDSIIRYFRTKHAKHLIGDKTELCDIGCGLNPVLLNDLSLPLKKRVGIDYLVQNSLNNNVELRQADLSILPLPLKNAEFDVITMLAVLEHLNNPAEVIAECYRGLKPDGKLIITTPSPASKPILETFAKLNVISRLGVFDHKHYFTKKELFELLQKQHFINIKVWHVALGLNTIAIAMK